MGVRPIEKLLTGMLNHKDSDAGMVLILKVSDKHWGTNTY